MKTDDRAQVKREKHILNNIVLDLICEPNHKFIGIVVVSMGMHGMCVCLLRNETFKIV